MSDDLFRPHVARGCVRRGCASEGKKRPALVLRGERDEETVAVLGQMIVCPAHEQEIGKHLLAHVLCSGMWNRLAEEHVQTWRTPPVQGLSGIAFLEEDALPVAKHDQLVRKMRGGL